MPFRLFILFTACAFLSNDLIAQTNFQLQNYVCVLKSAPKLNSEESKVARNHMERCFPDLTRIIYDESSAEFSLIGTTQLELCECLQLINEQGFFIGVYTNPNTQLTEQSMAACNEYLFNNIRQRWMNGSSTEKDD